MHAAFGDLDEKLDSARVGRDDAFRLRFNRNKDH
jgi:hypothetical protein